MIEINLVPTNLRKRKKRNLLPGGFRIPLEVVIGIGGGLIVLLIMSHFMLSIINMTKVVKLKSLKKEWDTINPQKNKVDVVIKDMRELQQKHKAIESLITQNRILWSQKLNVLSDSLPNEIWLRKVALNEKIFFIEGSAISKHNQEMINVHKFTSNLKSQKSFLKDLTDLELGSIQRQRIKNVEIADFLITIKLKDDENESTAR